MTTINIKGWTLEQKRALLDKQGGRMFSVQFIKKDGSLREMQCKRWVERHLTYGSGFVQDNPVAHKPEYYTVSDLGSDAFRNINLNTIVSINAGGVKYVNQQ